MPEYLLLYLHFFALNIACLWQNKNTRICGFVIPGCLEKLCIFVKQRYRLKKNGENICRGDFSMNKLNLGAIVAAVLIVSFGIGYAVGYIYHNLNISDSEQKPVIEVEEKEDILIKEDCSVVYEREYKRCGHVIISEFNDRQNLIGKNLKEIRKIYTQENGYSVSMHNDSLVIRQVVDDWCPEDKRKCRLKEYKGMVAVYKGPDSKNDKLLRVTSIRMDMLPDKIQEAIREGKYEFKDEQFLNDALENLDEYL